MTFGRSPAVSRTACKNPSANETRAMEGLAAGSGKGAIGTSAAAAVCEAAAPAAAASARATSSPRSSAPAVDCRAAALSGDSAWQLALPNHASLPDAGLGRHLSLSPALCSASTMRRCLPQRRPSGVNGAKRTLCINTPFSQVAAQLSHAPAAEVRWLGGRRHGCRGCSRGCQACGQSGQGG